MSTRFNIVLAAALALAAVSCSHGVSRIRTRPLPGLNPTTYSFPLPVEEVHAKALQAFSSQHQRRERIFPKSVSKERLESVLAAECATNAVYGKAVLEDPANVRDLYLHSYHTPFTTSPVYRGSEGGLPFYANFHLHLARGQDGSDTVVTVFASDTEVLNGTKFGIGSCGPGQKSNWVKVKPTTVEEYFILSYLGRYLGLTNMPRIQVPAE